MPYIRSLGAEETVGSPVALEVLTRLDERTKLIVEEQKRAERRWKWQAVAGVAGAIFAAVRLGIIAVPAVRGRGLGELGKRGNPSRASRRRRRRRARR
jgi:hypothetical protein